MLRAPAVKARKTFLIKLQVGRFPEGQSPRTGLANTLLGTAAVVAPAATRSASNAILRLLLTRDLAHPGSSLPKPDCLSAQGRPVVRILLKLRPYPHLSHNGAISFAPFPPSLLSYNALECDSDSNLREQDYLSILLCLPLCMLKFIPK